MKVSYTARARADIEAIGDYLARRSPRSATKVGSQIRSTIDRLAEFPHLGRRQKSPSMRKFVDEQESEIVIVNIRHTSRKREFDDT